MKSIRAKLWTGMMILVAVIILILWLFQIVFLDKFYSVLEIGSVEKKGQNIITEIEKLSNLSQLEDNDDIVENLDNYSYAKQLSVEVLDSHYKVIYNGTTGNNANSAAMMEKSFLSVAQMAMSGRETRQKITHPKNGYNSMIIGIPIENKENVVGAMIITMPMASLDETVDILKSQLIIITIILLFVALLISYILSRKFADPISKISRQADSYGKGDYQVRNKQKGDDEIGKLAKQMDDMGEALGRNEVLQKELIANVSHELRTPLTLIRGYAETLRDVSGNDPEKREKQLGVIIEESKWLGSVVEDILNLSRLQARAVSLTIEEFSLRDVLESMKMHFNLNEENKSIELVGVRDAEANIIGDKNKIQQVFYNLIGNAFHHSRENQSVIVAALHHEDMVRIEIRDQGEGIAPEDIEHVFERYYKGKHGDGTNTEGSGLGLAIVKSILDMHELQYGVESKVGVGTVFWFELKKKAVHKSF